MLLRRNNRKKRTLELPQQELVQLGICSSSMGALPSSCMEELDMRKKPSLLKDCADVEKDYHHHRKCPLTRLRKHPQRPSPGLSLQDRHGCGREEDEADPDHKASHPETNASSHSPQLQHNRHYSVLRRIGNGSNKAVHSCQKSVCEFFKALEDFLFPRNPLHDELVPKKHQHGAGGPSFRGGVMLEGCSTTAEHYQKLQKVLDIIANLHGAEGLQAAGLEFRPVLCPEHRPLSDSPAVGVIDTAVEEGDEDGDEDENDFDLERESFRPLSSQPNLAPTTTNATADTEVNTSIRSTESLWGELSQKSEDSLFDNVHLTVPQPASSFHEAHESVRAHCHLCHRRLYHIESNTPISTENRKKYIADGDMYEAISELCQEYAHEVMCLEAGLEWVPIEDDGHPDKRHPNRPRHSRSIRAMVNSNHPLIETRNQSEEGEANRMVGRPTILIATGRGKVQAGIFSRHHLICTSLESSTALPIVREAVWRNLNVVIPDPNAHGEQFGYETFRKTMQKLFSSWEWKMEDGHCLVPTAANQYTAMAPQQGRHLYVLSHSASGSQVVRYLLDKSKSYMLPHIRAIAFTDSTHNIQWAKGPDASEGLYGLLESGRCIYFRCSNEQRDSNWYLHTTGEEIKTDSFWQHRFGKIKTYWAGTNEHSLTNWYAHAKIWEHFDAYLSTSKLAILEEEKKE